MTELQDKIVLYINQAIAKDCPRANPIKGNSLGHVLDTLLMQGMSHLAATRYLHEATCKAFQPESQEVQVVPFEKVTDLLVELGKRSHIRLVKIINNGLAEPVKKGDVFVMQPRTRVAMTAFDIKANEILSWESTWDVGVNADCDDHSGEKLVNRLVFECEKRSIYVVLDDEWLVEDLQGSN